MMPEPTQELKDALHQLRFKRRINIGDIPKCRRDTSGKKLCRWCGGPLPNQRRTWCSPDCAKEFSVRFGGESTTAIVFRRDKGVCAACGFDTKILKEKLGGDGPSRYWNMPTACYRYRHGIEGFYEQWGPWASNVGKVNAWWQADHIIPVVEGGGCCGLDNLQTLCLRCHKEDTRRLAKRRSRKRRIEKTGIEQAELFEDAI